jgi:succinate-acetate transporter protein
MEKRIGALGAAFLFGGLLLVFGAVGGMEHQPDYFWAQTATAVVGLFWMWVGARFLAD